MYSQQNVFTRFASQPPVSTKTHRNVDHFVCVKLQDGQWQYDTNVGLVSFTPVPSDLLVATVDFSADVVTLASGQNSQVGSPPIQLGYASGDLQVLVNRQNDGSSNPGEFGLEGSYIITNSDGDVTTTSTPSRDAGAPGEQADGATGAPGEEADMATGAPG